MPAFAFALLACAGCTKEVHHGDATTYTWAWWVPVAFMAVCFGVFFGGFALRRTWDRGAYAVIVAGPLVAFLIGPNLLLDRLTIDSKHLAMRTGFWFAPTVHNVSFDGLVAVDLVVEERPGRRGGSRSDYLLFHKGIGPVQKVPVNDLMEHGALDKLIRIFERQGIEFNDRS